MKDLDKKIKEKYPVQTGINNPILRKKSEEIKIWRNHRNDRWNKRIWKNIT